MNSDCFFTITYGLYILCSKNGDKLNGHINNTCFQVTAEPAQFAVCSHKNNLTTDFIKQSKVFSISAIQENVDMNFIGHWGFKSGREFDKFEGINYKTGITGAPIILEKTVAFIECSVVKEIDVGSHIIFIGKVEDADYIDKNHSPLTYNYYRNVIKGFSPKNAPTYIDKSIGVGADLITNDPLSVITEELYVQETKSVISEQPETIEDAIKDEYICSVCGFVYDSDEGDPTSGIKPGTHFNDLPDDWICPICGVEKDMFHLV